MRADAEPATHGLRPWPEARTRMHPCSVAPKPMSSRSATGRRCPKPPMRCARSLGVPAGDVLLGAHATETRRNGLLQQGILPTVGSCASPRTAHSAVRSRAQPSPARSDPVEGTSDLQAMERDDSFLTSCEIAIPKLPVSVQRGGCPAPRGQGALRHSASSIYAGVCALLVSHWELTPRCHCQPHLTGFCRIELAPRDRSH